MVSIGVLELKAHEQYLVRLCRLLEDDLTVFTTSAIREDITTDASVAATRHVTKRPTESLSSYLGRVERVSSALDMLVCFPFSGGRRELFQYARFSPNCPSLLWVFNARGWLQAPVLTSSPRESVRRGLKRWIVRKQRGLLFEYPSIRRYVTTAGLTRKQTYTFVPAVFTGRQSSPTIDPVTVTVPGNVDPARRDYDTVLGAFREAVDAGASLRLELLGRPAEDAREAILSHCRALADEGYDIRFYDDWIPVDTFRQTLRDSTLLVAPLRRTKRVEDIVEYYSKTKGSGNIADAIHNATPLVLPDHARFEDSLGESGLFYGDRADLADTFERVSTDRSFREHVSRAADRNATQYEPRRQRERFTKILESVIDGQSKH
ncbi:hypothetical protein [Haloarcula marina]|uniref:hypothetical protein n=1 Tax=Haloarcula marina TaxID=2961574 RepID=UPI0020B6F892|nr:hypothetical protein [Halomicroarcula marina]